MIYFAAVFIVAALFVFAFILDRRTRRIATTAAEHVITRTWPHPIIGNYVAYTNNPTLPIGQAVAVDGSGRVRIRRFDHPGYVRRSIARLVIWKNPHVTPEARIESTNQSTLNH